MQEHRVYGPPGTGKTSYLTKYVTNAVAHYGLGGVMVCSFTTATAAEVARRTPGLPEDCIGTLHKFCFAAIGRMPVLEGKASAIKDWNEYAPVYAMSTPGCKDINSGLEYGDSTTLGDSLFQQTTVLRNKMIPREQWPTNLQDFQQKWQSFKAQAGGIDYTDMLEIALRDCHSAPGNPRIIFVDEAQDCTALQFAVLRQWAQRADQLVMVGDDDQCIYQFAGATPEAFAVGQIGPDDVLLSQSHRLPYNVWEFACSWINKVRDRVDKIYLPRLDPDPGFVKHCPWTFKQGANLADLISKTMLKYDTVMVIGSCSYMIEPVKHALLDAGIPFHNPYRMVRGDWNPLRLGGGTTYAQRITSFLAPRETGKAWTTPQIKDWASVLKAEGILNRGYKTKLNAEDFEQTPAYQVILDFFTDEARQHILDIDLKWWTDNLVNEDAARKAAFPLRVIDTMGEAFLDTDAIPPSVILGTIHSVKGAEADAVIVIPDLSQEGMQQWTGRGRSAIRRLMYVGITRARQGVFVCKPASQYTCDL